MSVAYNPFELFNLPVLKQVQRSRKLFLVIQRFNWPGVPANKGFMVSPYDDVKSAKAHADKLLPKEGRLLDLQSETDKVTALINDPQYLLFLNTFREPRWANMVLRNYQKNIVAFLRANTSIRITDQIDIELLFEHGRLKAVVQSGGPKKHLTLTI